MSTNTCYYYDEQRNRCNCYVSENLNELLVENAKLRKERDFYFNQVTENGERAQRAIEGLNAENAKLWELRELVPELCEQNAALFRENAKLRELMRNMRVFIPADCMEYCKRATADDGCIRIGECWHDRHMRELGMETE